MQNLPHHRTEFTYQPWKFAFVKGKELVFFNFRMINDFFDFGTHENGNNPPDYFIRRKLPVRFLTILRKRDTINGISLFYGWWARTHTSTLLAALYR
ncbi:MAG: hypothetical protein ACLRW3_09490 [Eubacterium sp.]